MSSKSGPDPEKQVKQPQVASPSFKGPTLGKNFLDSIDETPEFHDPYSDLSLFLSQKIKQEMHHCSSSKKWTLKLQDELIHKIGPEFEKRFPHYRLGVSALKRTWEKVSFYSSQIQDQREALTQEGKLNLSFLIKENLKNFSRVRQSCQLHPYHYAHQLAVKMSECIAIVDGTKPKLDELTRTIWSIHRHLIPKLNPEELKSPYDEYDRLDKLIVKLILQITSQKNGLSQAELSFAVRQTLTHFRELLKNVSMEDLEKVIATLVAEKIPGSSLKAHSPYLSSLSYRQVELIEQEIAFTLIDKPTQSSIQLIQEVSAFFQKLSSLDFLKLEEDELERKIQIWSSQGEMLCRWVRLGVDNTLFKKLKEAYIPTRDLHLEAFTSSIAEEYRNTYPQITPYYHLLKQRIWMLLKHLWYAHFPDPETSTFDRFLKWHLLLLREQNPQESPENLLQKLQALSYQVLPLVPFEATRMIIQ